MLPVSQYEALLAEVRGLRRKAQRVQQLATPLISNCSTDVNLISSHQNDDDVKFNSFPYMMEPPLTRKPNTYCDGASSSFDGDATCSEDECGGGPRRTSTNLSISSEPILHCDSGVSMLYHGTWPVEKTMWNSEPTSNLTATQQQNNNSSMQIQDVSSVMSFASSSGGVALDRVLGSPNLSRRSSQQLEAKVDMVYSLLAMLSGQEHADMGETLLALSTNPESCLAMRQSGCIPLLVQMVQSDREAETRRKASMALHNLVHSQPDEKLRKREIRIFKLLEQARVYTEAVRMNREQELDISASTSEGGDRHPVQNVAHLMKLSFDELHRQAICQLGGIYTIANLVEAEHTHHGSTSEEAPCILMRRYACMALTNLTFGDSGNKALLCSLREFMRALVVQLQSPSDELRQVTASVLRNLSWRADSSSKEILREVGSVTGLMKSAMLNNKENTLKSILSALWNLSAHCTENKSEICSVEGALGFLVDLLLPSRSIAIVENSGGILRNISSQISVREDYREILRQHDCLQILLDQLKSPSLTIVSNACGTLWNLSAKSAVDQEALWQLGAPSMLRSLNHSKHKMIAMGSSAALKNLLSAKPSQTVLPPMDSTALAMDLPALPTLGARKQRALLQDLDQTLSETYENIEKDSPTKNNIPSNDFFESKPLKHKFKHNGPNNEVYSDEKDHCSIEDVSDNDNPSLLSLTTESINDSDFLTSGLAPRREIAHSSMTNTSLQINTHKIPLPTGELDESIEKHDLEKEKKAGFSSEVESMNFAVKSSSNVEHHSSRKTSGVPVPRSLPRSIPQLSGYSRSPSDLISPIANVCDQSLEKDSKVNTSRPSSGLPRRVFKTSTPLRTNNPTSASHVKAYEASKVQNIDTNRKCETLEPPWSVDDNELAETAASPNLDLPSLTCFETQQPPHQLFNENLNISLEHNISQSESDIMGDQLAKEVEDLIVVPDDECDHFNKKETNEEEKDCVLERSCEDGFIVDNRMLDPDAMIESLERFTAELVSQASHLQSKDEDKFKDNTWNDDTSPNDVTFPSISGTTPSVVTFESSNGSGQAAAAEPAPEPAHELPSNDFSSLNTSTMTQSTLIAIEASKMAQAFRDEAELSESVTSVASLELDMVQQPSLVDSYVDPVRSPKLLTRKKSLPRNLMVRRVLTSSINNASSLESLDNQSWTNLDHINPPSILGEVFDMDGSITSVASLPSESRPKADFVINGAVSKRTSSLAQKPGNMLNMLAHNSISDLENINPPSLLNEITDMCNSLADVPTEAIGSETELFEDCQTHVPPTEDDVTEFSDANSATPIQSDFGSSPEATPKKASKRPMTSKQRRNLARDRYKTYTIAAEMVMKEEQSTSEDFQTVECFSEEYKSVLEPSSESATYVSPTYSVKLSPKEKRQLDRSRYETQTVPEPITDVLQQPQIEQKSSPSRSKLSIRRNFMQKRLENRDRFKTQTLNESQLPPGFISPQISENENDLHLLVQKEANLVLKSLKETHDDLLECETLSLVSNDDDSEQNSGGSYNYRTYHKSWGLKKNIPVIEPVQIEAAPIPQPQQETNCDAEEGEEDECKPGKPKIVKPSEKKPEVVDETTNEPESKGIRGRRKALYSKSTISNKIAPKTTKPIKTMTSNLVKNVTSTFKSVKPKIPAKTSTITKPPTPSQSRISSGYGTRTSSPKTSPAKRPAAKAIERQGTFTKEETVPVAVKSRIPAPASKLPTKAATSKLPMIPRSVTSASADRMSKPSRIAYARSTSADSRETTTTKKIQNSASSQSLKTTDKAQSGNGVNKRSLVPPPKPQRSGSNSSINSGSNAKKQVTSKIASLWKKIEESKNKQPAKKDTRVWIQAQVGTVDVGDVVLRDKNEGSSVDANGKRISRLGSFIVMDENGEGVHELLNTATTATN